MYNSNDQDDFSPKKKLRVLSEKQVNVSGPKETFLFEAIKENLVIKESQPQASNNKTEDCVEPLMQEAPGQYVIFPINHEDMWSMYKSLVDNFWSFTDSVQELDKLGLKYNENKFMKQFASIFATSQGLVNENFAEEFCKLIQVTEAKFFYGHQLFVQNIHYEMYNMLLNNLAPEQDEKEKLFKTVENYDSVIQKKEWIAKWKYSSLADQLMASSCMHGLLFCSLDLICTWLKNRSRNQFNHEIVEIFERMIHDQELQRDFSCLMISHLKNKPPKEKIIQTINEAAKLEFNFLLNGLNIDLIEFDTEEIIQLIDRKTKDLKNRMFGYYDEGKKMKSQEKGSDDQQTKIETIQAKENHQKITFDEDF